MVWKVFLSHNVQRSLHKEIEDRNALEKQKTGFMQKSIVDFVLERMIKKKEGIIKIINKRGDITYRY
jgi:hypothetical protein